ncbi:hypothetical protein LBMAG48_06220 [Phycisphaerae bacterium]|nr:hypothetical protein LBMAG48_06220 [Phycisphaerae bacterium]
MVAGHTISVAHVNSNGSVQDGKMVFAFGGMALLWGIAALVVESLGLFSGNELFDSRKVALLAGETGVCMGNSLWAASGAGILRR